MKENLFLTLVDTMENWLEEIYDRKGGGMRSDQLSTHMARAALAAIESGEDSIELAYDVLATDEASSLD